MAAKFVMLGWGMYRCSRLSSWQSIICNCFCSEVA